MYSAAPPISSRPAAGQYPHRSHDNTLSGNAHFPHFNGHTPPPFAGSNVPAIPRVRCPQMEQILRSVFPNAPPAAIEIAARGGLDHAMGLMSTLGGQPLGLTFFRPPAGGSNLPGFLRR
jgi:hypothetical protein